MRGTFRIISAAALTASAVWSQAQVQFVNLNDNGSSVRIVRNGVNAGVADRFVVGLSTDQLTEQSWWLRVGNEPMESRVGALGTPVVSILGPNQVRFLWTTSQLSVKIDYMLIGGVGNAALSEQIEIINLSQSVLDFSLFEYDDFDLGQVASDDTVTVSNPSTITQTSEGYTAQVSVSQLPSAMEVAGFPSIFLKLSDGDIDNLDPSLTTFTGDATFGMQWDRTLGPSQSFVMGKTKILAVPEPSAMLVLGLASACALRRKWLRTKI